MPRRTIVTPTIPRLRWLVTLAAAALSLAGCVGLEPTRQARQRQAETLSQAPWENPDEVIAVVNGEEITRGDYYRRVLEKFGTMTVLGGVIKQELFLQEAERKGITVSDEEVRELVEERLLEEAKMLAPDSDEPLAELERLSRSQGLSLDDVRRDMARTIGPQLLVGKVVKRSRVIDEAALREEYDDTYANTRYRLAHIAYAYGAPGKAPQDVIEQKKKEAMQKALRTVRRLREGADFGQIARNESQDAQSYLQGGDMGFLTREQIGQQHPAVREAILELEPGEVSEPVPFEELGSVHIFKLTDVVEHRAFDEVRDELAVELREREPDLEEVQQVLERLHAQSDVRILGVPFSGASYEPPVLDDSLPGGAGGVPGP